MNPQWFLFVYFHSLSTPKSLNGKAASPLNANSNALPELIPNTKSGTVSAAIEGFVQNKPSIAFSLNEFNVSKEVYSQVSKHASKIVNDIKDKLNILNDCILNVNIPNGEVKGTKITRLGERKYENVLEERVSPHGKRYFWIGGKVKELEQENDSDTIAIEEGYITITPVNIDMTNNKKIEILKNELL